MGNFMRTLFRRSSHIKDKYISVDEIKQAIKETGLESCNLIFGIDFTRSNLDNGRKTTNYANLHQIDQFYRNPYQQVIEMLGLTFREFDDDGLISAYGFGDNSTTNVSVFSFKTAINVMNPLEMIDVECNGFEEILSIYNDLLIQKKIIFAGPTNFAPLIKKSINIVKQTKKYHILIIIADGQVNNKQDTIDAIVEASNYALSIIMIGVGDGPWHMMNKFDDDIPKRKFDNFQFVNFTEIMNKSENTQYDFVVAAIQEIPDQVKFINKLKLL